MLTQEQKTDRFFENLFGRQPRRVGCPVTSHVLNYQGSTCKPGYVYVATTGNGLYKIGCSAGSMGMESVANRIRTVFGKNGYLVCAVYGTCARGLERHFHQEFYDVHEFNEIFRLTEFHIQKIKATTAFLGKPVTFINGAA